MPKRHCVLPEGEDGPRCRIGILQVFYPWNEPELLILQGYNVRHPEQRPQFIGFHFRQVLFRLVRSLGLLHHQARRYDGFLDEGGIAGPNPILAFEIPEVAGIAADSVFHYLTLFIDDLARIVPYVLTNEGNEPIEIDGFSGLKKSILDEQLPAPDTVGDLFAALDHDKSWWSLGFKRGEGIRQRLTHYIDLVYFRASTKPGDAKMTSDISLVTCGGPVREIDFESVLQELFLDMFEWLDQIDVALLSCLSERLKDKNIFWNPLDEPIPAIPLPEPDAARPDVRHYFYGAVLAKRHA